MSTPLLETRSLKKYFPVKGGVFSGEKRWLKAVDDVSIEIAPGRTVGLVGESGCGKSTLGRTILRLIEPTAGEILIDGRNIVGLPRAEMRALRGEMQIIFQDPYASLNPRMTVSEIVGEALTIHRLARGKEKEERVAALLGDVGLHRDAASRYPHEFSGGQRQRIGIARALAVRPKLIIADEPVSALDVSIQAQIINLLQDLQERYDLSYLFISHDLRVVEHVSDRVAVMYLGKIVEAAPPDRLYREPLHPYTMALLSAIPARHPRERKARMPLRGDVPSPIDTPRGCVFHPRCPYAEQRCRETAPDMRELRPGHLAACHLAPNLSS